MRSSTSVGAAAGALALAAMLTVFAAADVSQPAPPPLDEATVARAVDRVKADPNLATQRTIKSLRWKEPTASPTPGSRPAWLDWFRDFFRWIDQSARVLVWVVVGGLVAALAFYIVRTIRAWDELPNDDAFAAPTHVQDLDIRPESLPRDIGGAARRLWDRGEHRPALALLYRGLLSRLVHVHQLPVRDSSTEGDCLALSSRLGSAGRDYAHRLIVLWEAAVYRHLDADVADVYALCDGFSASLDVPPAGES